MWLRRGLAGVIICLAGLLIFRMVDRVDTSPPPLFPLHQLYLKPLTQLF